MSDTCTYVGHEAKGIEKVRLAPDEAIGRLIGCIHAVKRIQDVISARVVAPPKGTSPTDKGYFHASVVLTARTQAALREADQMVTEAVDRKDQSDLKTAKAKPPKQGKGKGRGGRAGKTFEQRKLRLAAEKRSGPDGR